MIILIDNRERLPLDFDKYDCQVEYSTLQSADYSIKGFDSRVGLERKSENDLLGSLTQGRKRFEAELTRLRGYELKAVICETSWNRLANGLYQSKMNQFSCIQSILGLSVRYGIQFIMAGNRQDAAYFVFHMLRHYLKQKEEDLKAAITQTQVA